MLGPVRKKKLVYWTSKESKRRNSVTGRYEEHVVEVGLCSLKIVQRLLSNGLEKSETKSSLTSRSSRYCVHVIPSSWRAFLSHLAA